MKNPDRRCHLCYRNSSANTAVSRRQNSVVKTKPEDHTVSLNLRFTKKRPNAMQRVFSFSGLWT